MATTLENFAIRAKRLIMKQGGTPPPLNELAEDGVTAIRIIQDRLPSDAMKRLLKNHVYAMTGSDAISTPDTDILRVVSLQAEESNGNYGNNWTLVSPERLFQIKRDEDELEQDSTNTRIFAVGALTDIVSLDVDDPMGWQLYPTPVNGRNLRMIYLMKATESGEMSLPVHLHHLVTYYIAGMIQEFELELRRIDKKYRNLYGLEGATFDVTGGR